MVTRFIYCVMLEGVYYVPVYFPVTSSVYIFTAYIQKSTAGLLPRIALSKDNIYPERFALTSIGSEQNLVSQFSL